MRMPSTRSGIGDRDHAADLLIHSQIERRRPFGTQRIGPRFERADGDTEIGHQPRIAERNLTALDLANDALAGHGFERFRFGDRKAAIFGGGDHGRGQGMLA